MTEPPQVRPVSRPVSVAKRVAMTALVPVLILVGEQIPLPHVDASWATGGAMARSISVLAIGLTPFITAYGLVELAALLVPPWRPWRHDARGRARLERSSAVLAIVLALGQGLAVAFSLEPLALITDPGWGTRVVIATTLAGGASVLAVAARAATRWGLLNGYVLGWVFSVGLEMARGHVFGQAALHGGRREVVLLVGALGIGVVATVLAVAGGQAIPSAVRVDGSAYRGGSSPPPRPWLPIPISSVQPIQVAASLLMFPATLANLKVPGMGALQSVLQRGDLLFDVVYGVLIVLVAVAASALLLRPEEISGFLRRLGSASDDAARADAISARRRALLPTVAYLFTLVVARSAAGPKVIPAMAVAIATGAMIDLAASVVAHVRARDLVCITQVHDAYQVPALRAALQAEGVDARARGMAILSLLQAFAPYAPVELYVRAGDADRASALLRHWAAGDAKPAPRPVSRQEESRTLWPLGARTAAITALGALALTLSLVEWAPQPKAGPARKRADVAVVRVDDAADPLKGIHDGDTPEGVALYVEAVPLGQGNQGRSFYARAVLRDGESLQVAWARLEPWLQHFALPKGDRWSWEAVTEPDEHDEQGMPVSFHVVGLRTIVLTGEPVIGTEDIVDAMVGLEDEGHGQAYVMMTLSPAARDRFYAVTQEWLGRRLAIVVDGHVDSAPVIRAPIPGGRVTITMGEGNRDKQLEEARRLEESLR